MKGEDAVVSTVEAVGTGDEPKVGEVWSVVT